MRAFLRSHQAAYRVQECDSRARMTGLGWGWEHGTDYEVRHTIGKGSPNFHLVVSGSSVKQRFS